MAERDKAIAQQREEIAERDTQIADMQMQLAMAKETLTDQNNLIGQQQRRLSELMAQARQQEKALANLTAQLEVANQHSPALADEDVAALRNLVAMEISWIENHLESKEQELANQARGRAPSTDEGRAKKERRKAELQAEIADLKGQRDRYRALLEKLEN